MTIFAQIRTGHSRLRLLAAGIEAPGTTHDRVRLLELLCDEVEAQAAAEEQIFYTALLALGGDPAVTRRVVAAHDEAAALAGAIADLDIDCAEARAGMRKLVQCLDRHIEEEEELLALARPLIAPAQAERLGERYLSAKADWIDTFGRVPQSVAATASATAAVSAPVPAPISAPISAPVPAPVPTVVAQAERLPLAGRTPAALPGSSHGWLRSPASPLRLVARGAAAMAPALWKRRQAAGHS